LRLRWSWTLIFRTLGVLVRAGRIASVVRGTGALLRPMAVHPSAFVHRMHALAHMRAGAER
jgi:hypothetical protein